LGVINRVRTWAGDSLALRFVILFLISGALTDLASANGWISGWNHPGRSGKFDVLFLVPFAIVWGFGCAIFLVKHSPHSFLSPDEMSEDPEKRGRSRAEGQGLFVFGFLAYGVVAALPIILIAWGLSALGLES
jgi:hypothetical protein